MVSREVFTSKIGHEADKLKEKAQAAAVESSIKDAETEEEFNEQAYLLYQYDTLSAGNTLPGGRNLVTYPNFVQLLGHPSTLLSKILGTGVQDFFDITPAEVALLHPYIRLFKNKINNGAEEKDIEIPFNEYLDNIELERITELGSILKNRDQRGSGIGIKSLEWEDTGQTPGETGKILTTTLVMVFASIADMYRKFGTHPYEASYADLIRFAPSQRKNMSSINDQDKSFYNDAAFRIKAQVGWAAPNDNDIIKNKKLLSSLENSIITFDLTLTNHHINISQEGKVVVTADYIGAIEGKMLSGNTDIMMVGNASRTRLKSFQKSAERSKKTQQFINQKIKEREENNRLVDSRFSLQELKQQQENYDALIQEIEEQENALKKENKLQSYSALLRILYTRSRIFAVDVDFKDIELFNDLRNEKFDDHITAEELEKEKIDRFNKYRETLSEVKSSPIQSGIGDNIKRAISSNTIDDMGKSLTEGKKISNATEPHTAKSKTHRINFVYFGDLIDAALQAMYRRLNDPDDDNIDPFVSAYRKAGIKNFRFLSGTVEIYDLKTNNYVSVPLCDIPISLNLFNSWFVKKVVEPTKDIYLLKDFLRDVCGDLIVKSLSPHVLGKFSRAPINVVSFAVFSLKNDASNPFNDNKESRGYKRVNVEGLTQTRSLKSILNPENAYQYFMMYVNGTPSNRLRGNKKNDLENYGIPHFYMGAEKGIMKNIQFERTDLQYRKESLLANPDYINKGSAFFSEPYDATLNLIGVPHFKPGMMIYVDPRSFAFPAGITREERIPIGGYYVIKKVFSKIEAGKFETILSTIFSAFGNDERTNTSGNATPLQIGNNEPSIDSVK